MWKEDSWHFEGHDITTPGLFSIEFQTGALGILFMCIDHYTVCPLVPSGFQGKALIKHRARHMHLAVACSQTHSVFNLEHLIAGTLGITD
jgi:hypothetical protein